MIKYLKNNKIKISIFLIILISIYLIPNINIIEKSYEHYLFNESHMVEFEQREFFNPFKISEINNNIKNKKFVNKIKEHIKQRNASIQTSKINQKINNTLYKKITYDVLEENKYNLLIVPQNNEINIIKSNINKPVYFEESLKIKENLNLEYKENKILNLKKIKFNKIYFENKKLVIEKIYSTNLENIEILKKIYYSLNKKEENICKNKDKNKYYNKLYSDYYKIPFLSTSNALIDYHYCDDFKVIEHKEKFELRIKEIK